MEASTIALIIIGIALILYITEPIPIATTSILACLALAIFGVVPFSAAFAGFGNDMVFLMAGMFVVGGALFETGVAQILGEKIISAVGTSEKKFVVVLILVATVPAAFLSNTAAMAMMLPIASAAVIASKGRFLKKNTYMIIGIAAVASGGLTNVGSTPQIIAQNALKNGGHEVMEFFELSLAGGPVILLLLIYYLTVGHILQKKVFTFPEVADEAVAAPAPVKETHKEKSNSKATIKRCISVAVLLFCITGFISNLWTLGIVAMVGATILVITGCISQKQVYQKMDWTTVIVIACSLGLSAGLEQSGAGMLVAHSIINFLGDGVTPWLLCVALAFVAVTLGNFMSSTATAALLVPIAISVAITLGFDVKSAAMAVVIAANISYATPVSTPPMTMTLSAGYRFMDYVKVGGLFNLLAFLLVIALFPFILNV